MAGMRVLAYACALVLSGCVKVAPYLPTPAPVVERMLELAAVTKDDVVYDLGSGDGRIVIAAAEKYGARGVGFEIDPALVLEARRKAEQARVAHLVEFRQQDLFTAKFFDATVVTLYLGPATNRRLGPVLRKQLPPGARILSHEYDMGDWEPDLIEEVPVRWGTRTIYMWKIDR